MNNTGDLRVIHLFAKGEIRVDGWQSPWLKDQLRRRAEDAAKSRPIVKATQIKRPQIKRGYPDPERQREIVRKSLQKRRLRLMAEGICRDCGKSKAKEGCTSCGPCLKARYDRQKRKRAELKEAA